MAGNPILSRVIRQTIYGLKQHYGNPIGVYKLTSASTDYKTGIKTASVTSVDVQKCIVLPSLIDRDLEQSISYISASKAFTSQGGPGWDEGLRDFIFDAQDLPPGYKWAVEDWLVYRDQRYDIQNIEDLEFSVGWLVRAKEVNGVDPDRLISLNIVDTLLMQNNGQGQ